MTGAAIPSGATGAAAVPPGLTGATGPTPGDVYGMGNYTYLMPVTPTERTVIQISNLEWTNSGQLTNYTYWNPLLYLNLGGNLPPSSSITNFACGRVQR